MDLHIHEIIVPVLITNSERSPRFFHVITDKLAECIKGAQRASFIASHRVPAEEPELFGQAVLNFLGKHATSSANASTLASEWASGSPGT
jgi:pimeloyl-ACP methyl ester carboxylesterase